jgi:hypothetical protein
MFSVILPEHAFYSHVCWLSAWRDVAGVDLP